jgi:hypothetical protein
MENEKNEIRPGQSVELLKELHILTRDGKLNQDSRRKLKQIYHLYNFIEPLLKIVFENDREFSLVDHGAGKSYLGFILYDLFFKDIHKGHIFGVETRDDLVLKSQALAKKCHFLRMDFLNLSVSESIKSNKLPEQIDIVTALHACDTATDDAIKFALNKNAQYIVLIPCCQAEVASILRKNKNASFSKTPLSEIWRHPIHSREFGTVLTNSLRSLLLSAHGYEVTVTEFIGLEHSMKNELIIAKKTNQIRGNAKERTLKILEELNLIELTERFAY